MALRDEGGGWTGRGPDWLGKAGKCGEGREVSGPLSQVLLGASGRKTS